MRDSTSASAASVRRRARRKVEGPPRVGVSFWGGTGGDAEIGAGCCSYSRGGGGQGQGQEVKQQETRSYRRRYRLRHFGGGCLRHAVLVVVYLVGGCCSHAHAFSSGAATKSEASLMWPSSSSSLSPSPSSSSFPLDQTAGQIIPHGRAACNKSRLLAAADGSDSEQDGDKSRFATFAGKKHDEAAKAKISKANKGRVPWNKGRKWSQEEKAKISAGTRAAAAAIKLEQETKAAAEAGMTVEEYREMKRQEEEAKRNMPRAKPVMSEASRKEQSERMKARWKDKEYREKMLALRPANYQHSEETKSKIRAKVKELWQSEEYREKMSNVTVTDETRAKISAAVRAHWSKPETRAKSKKSGPLSESHKEAISLAIRAKWEKDEDYRAKVQAGLNKRKTVASVAPRRSSASRSASSSSSSRSRKTATTHLVSASAEGKVLAEGIIEMGSVNTVASSSPRTSSMPISKAQRLKEEKMREWEVAAANYAELASDGANDEPEVVKRTSRSRRKSGPKSIDAEVEQERSSDGLLLKRQRSGRVTVRLGATGGQC